MGHVSEFLRPKDAVASNSKIFTPDLEESSYVVMRGRLREDRQMMLYVQTWLPLLTFTLTAAIFFGVHFGARKGVATIEDRASD
jgi:hypothetical protein